MEENDPKPSEAAAAAAAAAVEGQRQPESSPSGGSGGGGSSPGDADTGRRRALMLPAVLQAPGNHQHPHRITNFFIDNILRPEFGRRKDAGTCCAGSGRGRGGGGGGEGGAGGAEGGGGAAGAEQLLGSGREPRQNAPGAPGAGGPLPGGGGGDSPGDGEGGSKALSLHSGAKKGGDAGGPLDGALKARGLGGGDLSVSSDSDSSQASANLGAQPMLWPAWVYCTRYSDRPSSGESWGPMSWPAVGRPVGLRGSAGAGTYPEEEDTRIPVPQHKDTHTQRHCLRLTLTPAAAGRRGGRTDSQGGTDFVERQKHRTSFLSCLLGLSLQPLAHPSLGWSLFGGNGVAARQARKLTLSTPSPRSSNSVQTRDPRPAHRRPRLILRPSYPRSGRGRKQGCLLFLSWG